jgi:predicted outer membrane repeat protein
MCRKFGVAFAFLAVVLMTACINPIGFYANHKETLEAVGGSGDLPERDPVYPPLTSLSSTSYEGALGLEWTWPQEARAGDEVVFDYAPEETDLPSARSASARAVGGDPAGGTFTLQYPQTATVINDLTPNKRYAVRGQIKYGDIYSVGIDKITITLNLSITIEPSGPSIISAVYLNDLVTPKKYEKAQYVVVAQDPGVYAVVTWDDASWISENMWDQARSDRYANIVYAPRSTPRANIELFVFHTDAWAFANSVTVYHNGSSGTATVSGASTPASRVFTFTGQDTGDTSNFYVSRDSGNDNNPGTVALPMYTLNGALQRIKAEKTRGSTQEVTITIDGEVGDYYQHHSDTSTGSLVSIHDLTVKIKAKVGTLAVIEPDGDIGTAVRVLNITGSSIVELTGIEIADGKAENGAGISITGGRLDLNRSNIRDNEATNSGGGIYVSGGATLNLKSGAIVERNSAGGGGGGIYVDTASVVVMSAGSEIRYNTASGSSGGGVSLNAGTLTMENNSGGGRIHGNHVINTRAIQLQAGGGGVYVGMNSTFTMNAGEIGGGQFAQPILSTIHATVDYGWGPITTDTNIYGMMNHVTPPQANTADVNGGGVFVEGSGIFTMTGGTISLNEAIPLVFGGENEQTLQLQYTTRGGGIFVQDGGHLTINKSTGSVVITENISTYGGGIYTKAAVDIERTFWESNAPTGATPNLFGTVRIINNYALGGGEKDPWGDYVTSGGGGYNIHVWYEGTRDEGITDPIFNNYLDSDLAYTNNYKLGYPVDPHDVDRIDEPFYAGYYDSPDYPQSYYDSGSGGYIEVYPYYWIDDAMSAMNRGGSSYFEASELPYE